MSTITTRLLAPLALVALVGCGGEAAETTTEGTETTVTEAPAPEAPKTMADKVQGEWTIVLSEQDQKQLDAMKLAFRDPAPTEEDIKAAGLGEEEAFLVAMIVMSRNENPDDPKIAEMKAMMDGMSSATMTISADSMTMSLGPNTETATYTVAEQTDTEVKVTMKEKDGSESSATMKIDGDVLTITEAAPEGAEPSVMTFKKKG